MVSLGNECETCKKFGQESCAKHGTTIGFKINQAIDKAVDEGRSEGKKPGTGGSCLPVVALVSSGAVTAVIAAVRAYARLRAM